MSLRGLPTIKYREGHSIENQVNTTIREWEHLSRSESTRYILLKNLFYLEDKGDLWLKNRSFVESNDMNET